MKVITITFLFLLLTPTPIFTIAEMEMYVHLRKSELEPCLFEKGFEHSIDVGRYNLLKQRIEFIRDNHDSCRRFIIRYGTVTTYYNELLNELKSNSSYKLDTVIKEKNETNYCYLSSKYGIGVTEYKFHETDKEKRYSISFSNLHGYYAKTRKGR